jgi:uncharacterized protein YpmB
MNKAIIIITAIIILAIICVAVWFYWSQTQNLESIQMESPGVAPQQSATLKESDSVSAINADLEGAGEIDLDKEFKDIDADLNNL